MTALTIDRIGTRYPAGRSHAVPMLQVLALAVMIFPSTTVIKVVGADGYPAALVSYFIFLTWIAATLFGLHNPLEYRYPVRSALCVMWLVSLASYALMNRGMLTVEQQSSADRWLMQLADISGVVLLAAECLHSIDEIRRVLRVLIWGGAFCGVVAGLQFKFRVDISPYLAKIPGFTQHTSYIDILSRNGINRVVGTAIQPIELGVVTGMLLPLAIYLVIYDVGRSKASRWFPVLCIVFAIPVSISRSAIIAAGAALGVFILSLPPARRRKGLVILVLGVTGVFVIAGNIVSTLTTYILAGKSDSSVAHRINNYSFVEHLVEQTPWLGHGGGTYIGGMYMEQNSVHILDNQYLTTAIELGLIGVAVLTFFFLWPAIAALVARSRTADQELRDLCAALAGSALAAALCSATFDSLSFPMFFNVQALIFGLIGAVWLLANQKSRAEFSP